MSNYAIIAAGGVGSRLGNKAGKQLLEIKSKPIVVWTIEKFEQCSLVDEIIIVIKKDDISFMQKLVAKYKLYKVKKIVESSEISRFYSVKNGVEALNGKKGDKVLIHDGSRPLIGINDIEAMIRSNEQALVIGTNVIDTIKVVNKNFEIIDSPKRETLYSVQTPQMFAYELLQNAYRNVKDDNFTDEAGLISASGVKVKIFPGSYDNIKVTTKFDLKIVEERLIN